jgi:serine/threonine-protein kinase
MEKIGHISFGDIAVNLGYTTAERVNECLDIQRKIRDMGVVPKKLGEVMIDKGYLTETQVRDVFQKQGLEGGHTQIIGYKIIALIGQGAMGAVYKAVQLSMEREVALKVLSPHLIGNEKFVMRFFKEARAVARLNHPNIIQGIDVGESNGIHYFAMEYVEGNDLDNIVKAQGPIEEKKLIGLMIQASLALGHAHKNNMVHRDIKPRNIMISRNDNSVKLCDLGLAKVVAEGDASPQQKIRMGTPAYISPEQARGDHDIDIRSDIYSLGVTFYFCITGDIPFRAETALLVMNKHINEQPIPPKQKNPRISNIINTIILKMMTKKREGRYQTPAELIADLEKALRVIDGNAVVQLVAQQPPKMAPAKPGPLVGKISEQTVQRLKARRLARLGFTSKRRFKR